MDIQKWLQATADRAPPDASDNVGVPGSFRPGPAEVERIGQHYRHKRKHASSDSSIIMPRPAAHRTGRRPRRASSPEHERRVNNDVEASQDFSVSVSSRGISNDPPQKSYERRARHKTRPDRYEPKLKKQRNERNTRKEKITKQKRRRSHRSGDGHRTTGLVQSFQLKNGPKNNRLTLKPDSNAGLFKHGRASVQMTGRGGGLPDLLFNEMRFLQKPTEHQDEPQQPEAPGKSNTKGRKRPKEEEISAYFSARNGNNLDQNHAAEKERRRPGNDGQDQPRGARPGKTKPNSPAVELPEKPFLGFGSKGAQLESKDAQDEDTGCYTWSDSSPREARLPRTGPLATPALDAGQLSAKRQHSIQRRSKPSNADMSALDPNAVSQSNKRGHDDQDEWILKQRARRPTLVELDQPSSSRKHQAKRNNTAVTKTTSQSLPRHSSSAYKANRSRRPGGGLARQRYEARHTSDILNFNYPNQSPSEFLEPQHQHLARKILSDKENHDPHSSFSIDRALYHAQEAVAKTVPASLHGPQSRVPALKEDENIGRQSAAHHVSTTYPFNDTGRSQWYEPEETGSRAQDPAPKCQKSAVYYEHNPKANMDIEETESAHNPSCEPRRGASVQQPCTVYEDGDEMLDKNVDSGPVPFTASYVYADSRQVEDSVHRRQSEPRSGIFKAQVDRLEHDVPVEWLASDNGRDMTASVRGRSIEHEYQGSALGSPQEDVIDEAFVGFWKPHKLY